MNHTETTWHTTNGPLVAAALAAIEEAERSFWIACPLKARVVSKFWKTRVAFNRVRLYLDCRWEDLVSREGIVTKSVLSPYRIDDAMRHPVDVAPRPIKQRRRTGVTSAGLRTCIGSVDAASQLLSRIRCDVVDRGARNVADKSLAHLSQLSEMLRSMRPGDKDAQPVVSRVANTKPIAESLAQLATHEFTESAFWKAFRSVAYRTRLSLASDLAAIGIKAWASKYREDTMNATSDGQWAATRLLVYMENPCVLRFDIFHNFTCCQISQDVANQLGVDRDRRSSQRDIEISFLPSEWTRICEWLPLFVAHIAGYSATSPAPPCGLKLDACVGGYAWTPAAEVVADDHFRAVEALRKRRLDRTSGGT
jgi:hypothetical protein